MTPAEVLKEIRSMPAADRKRVLEELSNGTDSQISTATKEEAFLDRMVERGLVLRTSTGMRGRKRPQKFSPIKVSGEPVSETIIKERR